MKDFEIRIRNGGDDAVAAMAELWEMREKILFDITDAFTRARWIPVSERLPEHDSNVLVAAKRDGEYVVKEMLFVDWSDPPDPPRPEWSDDWGGEEFENVTHWMPLPPPPKDEA